MDDPNKITVELENKQLEHASLTINGTEIVPNNISKLSWTIDCPAHPQEIYIYFHPWGLNPILRLNGFLINKWLGNVELQNHCMKFILDQDFFTKYRDKDLQGRMDSLGDNPGDIVIDRVVGRHSNSDIVMLLKEKLVENSDIS
jgi:hypothetical protein